MKRHLFILFAAFILIGCNGQKERSGEYYWEEYDRIQQNLDNQLIVKDSIQTSENTVEKKEEEKPQDTIPVSQPVKKTAKQKKAKAGNSVSATNKSKKSTTKKSTKSSYSGTSSSQSKYENDGHSGTKPDDPMFGYDYWDDEDNAYEMERNQVDAYPDDW